MNYKLTFVVFIRVFHRAIDKVGEAQIYKLYLSSTIENLNTLGLEISKVS